MGGPSEAKALWTRDFNIYKRKRASFGRSRGRRTMAGRSTTVGFSGFRPRYDGNIYSDPVVRAAQLGCAVEDLPELPPTPKTEVNNMASEYEYRFQGERYQLDNIPKEPRVYKDPWKMATLVEAELNEPRTKIDLSHGAIPKYGGYIPRYKFRFGESYGSLSVRLPSQKP